MTAVDEPLPFDVNDRSLVADEIVDDGIMHGDILYDQLVELLTDADGLDRGVIMLHLWHLQSRWLIDRGMSVEDMTRSGRMPIELIKYNLDDIYVWRLDDLKRDAESFTSLALLINR